MKKVSTVTAAQTKNFASQQLTIGLDLGDRSSWYCVLDEAGRAVLEQRLSTTPKAMREVFGGMPRSRVALETGMHSPWVSRLLSELGHEVIVAHARNVRLIGDSPGNFSVLYSFSGPDGAQPTGNVIRDCEGNLYGTTTIGGAHDLGTVYKLDPAGNETVLHSFIGLDGNSPFAGLIRDSVGNFYSTTIVGG